MGLPEVVHIRYKMYETAPAKCMSLMERMKELKATEKGAHGDGRIIVRLRVKMTDEQNSGGRYSSKKTRSGRQVRDGKTVNAKFGFIVMLCRLSVCK